MNIGFDVDPSDWDEAAFAQWLRGRVAELYSTDALARHRALASLNDQSPQPETPRQLLARCARGLPEATQVRFRVAIGRLLKQARSEWMPARAASMLVLLAGDLQAHEAIDAIVTVVGEGGDWGARSPALFVDALSVLKGMATAQEAWKPTWRLVEAAGFPKAAAFDAYEVLVHCRPDAWGATFVRLEPLFGEVLRSPAPPGQPRSAADWFDWRLGLLMQGRLGRLSLSTVLEGLTHLHGPMPMGPDQIRRLRQGLPIVRLMRALFEGPGRPYRLQYGEFGSGEPELARASQLAVTCPWPDTLPYFDVFIRCPPPKPPTKTFPKPVQPLFENDEDQPTAWPQWDTA